MIGYVTIAKLIAECGSSVRADGSVNPVPVVAHLSVHSIQTFLDMIVFYTEINLQVEFESESFLGNNSSRTPKEFERLR